MPDIDIDFLAGTRMIDYVTRKYGSDRVAQIITFGTMAARGAIRDVGRALNYPYSEVDMIAKQIPFEPGMTIKKSLQMNPELKKAYEEDQRVRNLIDTSKAVEGLPRINPCCRCCISKSPLTEHVPLQRATMVVHYTVFMGVLEELGLLKWIFWIEDSNCYQGYIKYN